MEYAVFHSIWEEIPSGLVEVLTFSEESRLSTYSSVHWILDSSGCLEGGQGVVGALVGSEKQLEKNALRRLALDVGEAAVTVPFVNV